MKYRRYNIPLLCGWVLYYHKDAWSCDIHLYNSWGKVGIEEFPQRRKQLDIVWWRCYNTLYGMAWSAIIFGITIQSVIANKASKE